MIAVSFHPSPDSPEPDIAIFRDGVRISATEQAHVLLALGRDGPAKEAVRAAIEHAQINSDA
jgi:hypothetical protein